MDVELKDSGIEWIGKIPTHWSIMPMKYISNINMGQSPPSEEVTDYGEVPFLQGNAEFGFIHPTPKHYCDTAPKVCNTNDILISVRAPVGATNLANQQYAIGRGLCAIAPKINSEFLFYALKKYSKDFLYYSNGSTFDAITIDTLSNFKIAIPSILEQATIAKQLNVECSHINQLYVIIKEKIQKLKELKRSLISELVTKGLVPNVDLKDSGTDWIGKIPTHWTTRIVKSLFRIEKRIAGELGYQVLSVTQNGIRIKNTKSNEGQLSEDYSKYQIVNPGDFVMNHMDLLTGYVDISQFKGVTSPDYRVFVANNEIFPKYALYIFQIGYKNKILYGLGQGVSTLGRWRLPREQFLKFNLPFPPYNEQVTIAQYLDKECSQIDLQIQYSEQFLEKLTEYKQSIIYEYVTGKKRVPQEV